MLSSHPTSINAPGVCKLLPYDGFGSKAAISPGEMNNSVVGAELLKDGAATQALEDAIPGCMNAFSILILVTSIYAILGVEFFSTVHPYFKNFSLAFFTMFQVMTGDAWSEEVARPVIDIYPQAAVFFISYILIATVMLMNVVIAVLLEKMAEVAHADSADAQIEKIEEQITNALDSGQEVEISCTLPQQIRMTNMRKKLSALRGEMRAHITNVGVVVTKVCMAAQKARSVGDDATVHGGRHSNHGLRRSWLGGIEILRFEKPVTATEDQGSPPKSNTPPNKEAVKVEPLEQAEVTKSASPCHDSWVSLFAPNRTGHPSATVAEPSRAEPPLESKSAEPELPGELPGDPCCNSSVAPGDNAPSE